MDDSFKKVPINVPKLSGFDKSHQNLLTTKVGTITPIMIDELIPGSKVHLKLALSAQLPPLATDTFMRTSIKVEAFFVPFRLLCGSFESWFTDEPKDVVQSIAADGTISTASRAGLLPCIKDNSAASDPIPAWVTNGFATGTLADYLGFKSLNSAHVRTNAISAMPFLAYHRIWNDWYRNSLVQKECFLPPDSTNGPVVQGASGAPYHFFTAATRYLWTSPQYFALADGKSIFDLRQRNFGLDYFTTATPSPQQGAAMVVGFGVDANGAGDSSHFSIAALRAANSLQQFKERNNLLGNVYVEQVYGRYGVRPSDGIAQRSLYLGRGEFEVYSKGVMQSAQDNQMTTNNPFNSVATRYGSAYAQGESFLVNFEAKEPGYLMVMATLVPRVTYSSGINRRFLHYVGPGSISDLANPILQNVGPQPISEAELSATGVQSGVFGYTDRYAEFKTMEDELHGLMRDGSSLDSFALQRSISGTPRINSSFLEIPQNYMDNVTAVTADLSNYGCWIDTFFDYKVAQPLAKYSLPSLQDPAYEHGKTLVVSRGGSKL